MKTTVKLIIAETLIALLLLATSASANAVKAKASSHEIAETTLQLESWMIDDSVWNSDIMFYAEFVEETETGLEIEDWMTSSEAWNLNFIEEAETELELEGWMINDETWVDYTVIEEPALTLEDWMIE